MTSIARASLILLFMGSVFTAAPLSAQQASVPGFAVVELFTSEGCSSCPPADQALSQLVRRAEERKLPIYALEWHVDYWDYLGWKDPWDSKLATERQYAYARSLPSSVYTPQAVVNGQVVASYAGDLGALQRTADSVAAQPGRGRVVLTAARVESASSVRVHAEVADAPPGSALLLVEVEGDLSATPNAGENAGRSLVHSNVVRAAKMFPASSADLALPVPPAEPGTTRRVIALLQDSTTLHVFAAAQAGLTPTGGNDLSGRVTGSDGRPVPGALIQACSGKLCVPARTDAEGFFTLVDLPAGRYEIDISPPRGSLARAGVKYFDHADKIVVARSVWK